MGKVLLWTIMIGSLIEASVNESEIGPVQIINQDVNSC